MLCMHIFVCPSFFYATIVLLMFGDITKKRVVVFGIFDGIHDGHRDLFRQAKEYGDELVVVVGRDESSLQLKNKKPQFSETERIRLLREEELVDDAVLGDKTLSSYNVLKNLQPQVVCIGYDQDALEQDLQRWIDMRNSLIELHRAEPYQQDSLHNSIML